MRRFDWAVFHPSEFHRSLYFCVLCPIKLPTFVVHGDLRQVFPLLRACPIHSYRQGFAHFHSSDEGSNNHPPRRSRSVALHVIIRLSLHGIIVTTAVPTDGVHRAVTSCRHSAGNSRITITLLTIARTIISLAVTVGASGNCKSVASLGFLIGRP